MRCRLLVCVLLAATSLSACGDDGEDAASDSNLAGSGPARVVDWRAGTYEGVRLGDSSKRLARVLGPPGERAQYGPDLPLGEEAADIGSLTNHGSPDIGRKLADFETFRYRHRVISTVGGRVTSIGTTHPRAQTPEGVAIGDDRDTVKRHYPKANCYIQYEGTEYADYPICRIQACAGRLMGIGGDPVKSIYLAAETKGALAACRRPTRAR